MLGRHFLSCVEFHTVKWCNESIDMVHIIWTLWVFIYVFWSKFVFCRKLILCTFKVQWYIQTIVNLKTIVDHCPQNFENHRKTIDTNGWALKKTFNGDGPTLSKPSKNHWPQWWHEKKTLTIPSLWKIDHRRGLLQALRKVTMEMNSPFVLLNKIRFHWSTHCHLQQWWWPSLGVQRGNRWWLLRRMVVLLRYLNTIINMQHYVSAISQ